MPLFIPGFASRQNYKLFFSISIFIFLVAVISYFTLTIALLNSYPDITLTFDKNPDYIIKKLNNHVNNLITEKRKVAIEQLLMLYKQNNSREKLMDKAAGEQQEITRKLVELSRAALREDPLNAELYRLLGQLYELTGNSSLANNAMFAASELSSQEAIAHELIFRNNLKQNNLESAYYYADRLFSFAPEVMRYYVPAFKIMIENDTLRKQLVKFLSRKPNWRIGFFSQIVPQLSDSQSENILSVFRSLKTTSNPPTNGEINLFLTSLIAQHKYRLAYQSWTSLLPQEETDKIAYINNGGFDRDLTGAPFDWSISGGKESRAQINSYAGQKSNAVLNVEFGNGCITLPNISQLVLLNSGNYYIEGRYKGEIMGKRGLFWAARCVDGRKIGTSNEIIGRFIKWTQFKFEIVIPDEKCEAQILYLLHGARSPSEQILSGSISFDDILVTKTNE